MFMGSSDIIVVILELPMKQLSNEMIYLTVTKPHQAKYCLLVMSMQKRVFTPKCPNIKL